MSLDMAAVADADWAFFDQTELVSVVRVSAAGVTESTAANVLALPRMLAGAAEGVGGPAQASIDRLRWHLRASTVGRPRRGDRIVSTSAAYAGTWVITGASVATWGTRYVCETVRGQ